MTTKFLIQTIDDKIEHDFSFGLVHAIKYQNWYYNEVKYDYYLTDDIFRLDFQNYIPVGSVEFVLDFYKQYYGIENIKPINIPNELWKFEYLRRNIIHYSELEDTSYLPSSQCFVKSNDKIKGFANIIKYKDIPKGDYLISDLINIVSEWRAFIFNKKLVGLQNYSGDFTVFPDVDLIDRMIKNYKSSPKAYTLDVGINYDDGTFLIEVHQFFSCGLYGFADYRILPQMFISTHREIIS